MGSREPFHVDPFFFALMEKTPEQNLCGLADQLERLAAELSEPDGSNNSETGMGDRVIVQVIRPKEKDNE